MSAAMAVLGTFHVVVGIGALEADSIPSTPSLTYTLPPATWGWTQIALGALVVLTGAGVLWDWRGARTTGFVLAALGLFVNSVFLLLHPAFAAVLIAVDVLVIGALTVRWPDRR